MGLFSGITDAIGGVLGGVGDVIGDVVGGIGDVAKKAAPFLTGVQQIGDIAAPVLAYGATEDQLQQQYQMFREAQGFSANETQLQFLRNEMLASSAHNRSMHAASTQYQRAVADMKAAGLNPMLAYRNGGAAAPVSSAGSASAAAAPGQPNIPNPTLNAITTALQVRRLNADVQLAEANAKKATEEAKIPNYTTANLAQQTQNLGVMHDKLQYELKHILPEQRANIIADTLLKNATENWTQQRYLHEFDRIKLTKLEAAKVVQQIELLKGDVRYQDQMKNLPLIDTLARALGLFIRRGGN